MESKEKKYFLIECGINIDNDIVFDICDKLKEQGDYFNVNWTTHENQFDVKRVTKEQFEQETI